MKIQKMVAVRRSQKSMGIFTVEELREVISVKVLAGRDSLSGTQQIRKITTDSRVVRRGDLFVALRGPRFDGHDFVPEVLTQGAAGVIVRDGYSLPLISIPKRPSNSRSAPFIFGVRDSLFAYQQLATHHRSRFVIPVVAVTGSNGKTTTKDFVSAVLAECWSVLKTKGNLNNRIGVPHTLLQLTARHQAAVIELGVDQQGQTTRLCEITKPTIGVITNIGPDHLEFFGNIEGSAQAKAEMLDMLSANGSAILNADDPYFDYLAARTLCGIVSFGLSEKADIRASEITLEAHEGMSFRLHFFKESPPMPVHIKVHGIHNVMNALAAAAVGAALNLSSAMIIQGLGRFRPAAMRSEVITHHNVTIVNDCYNANPASMTAALELLGQWSPARDRIAVLGDMLELGSEAGEMHRNVGAFVAKQGLSRLIVCGTLGKDIAKGAREAGMVDAQINEVVDAVAAANHLKSIVRQGDVVLVKASRSLRMEQVVQAVTDMSVVVKSTL